MLLISGGLGEDASFDLEFISKFCSKVVLVDPTDEVGGVGIETKTR